MASVIKVSEILHPTANVPSLTINSDSTVSFDAGILNVTGPINGVIGANTPYSGTFTSLSDSGNLTFTGTGNRIIGDFSNATTANRAAFQSSTVNGQTRLALIPNGNNTDTAVDLYNNSSDIANAGRLSLRAGPADMALLSTRDGTGTFLPLVFHTGGSERVRIDTSGNVGIGSALPKGKLTVLAPSSTTLGDQATSAINIIGDNGASKFWQIAFGSYDTSFTNAPASIGYVQTTSSGFNNGALVFATRNVVTDTAPTERMRIDSSGNVGINTSSPITRLDVNNAIFARPGTTALASEIKAVASDYLSLPSFTNTGSKQFGSTASGTTLGLSNASLGILEFINSSAALIYTNGATPIVFGTNSTERMRIDSAGNVGIGTSSPSAKLEISLVSSPATGSAFGGGANNILLLAASGSAFGEPALKFQEAGSNVGAVIAGKNIQNGAMAIVLANRDTSSATSALTERMRIDPAGNVGIGLLSNTPLAIKTANDARLRFINNGATQLSQIQSVNLAESAYAPLSIGGLYTALETGGAERMRIDSSGNLLVGTTSAFFSTNSFFVAAGADTPAIFLLKNSAAASTDRAFCVANGSGGGTVSFQVLANGNAQNTNNSYGAISDIKLKENIVDATPKLDDLMKVQVRQYNFIADETKTKQLGVVAQELEQVFPGMIEETLDFNKQGKNLGTTTKSVKYSVFVPMLIKAIQEQQAIIDQQDARIKTLEGNV